MKCRMMVFGTLLCCCFLDVWGQEPVEWKADESPVFSKRTVDFPEIRKLGTLRVAVPFSRG